MIRRLCNIALMIMIPLLATAQEKSEKELQREARDDMRVGNELYNQLKFDEAEVAYKKALSKNPYYPKASYNLGNAIYQQDRNKEAVNQFELVEKTFDKKMSKAEAYHNMGNAFMKEKDYGKAVEAFKNSMRNNSKDDETRYNLALAKEMLKKQQQQQNQNQDNKNDENKKDKNDDKEKSEKEKEGGDEERKQDENDEKDKGKDKENDQGDKKKPQDNEQDKNKQPRPNQLTPEQMKQLLEAMNNEENKTQKKLNAKKAQGKKIKQAKDW